MRAIGKFKAEEGLWMDEVEEPRVGPNDLLIQIRKTSLCGTDLHIYNWDKWAQRTLPVPVTIGHEWMGVVVDAGTEVQGFAVGDRVAGEGHITCGHCRNCRAGRRHLCRNTVGVGVTRNGAFADLLSLPAINAFKLPNDISDEIAAIFDPFGNGVHSCLSFPMVGEDVLITGAGPIGIMSTAICQHVGARFVVVTDINDYRLDMARQMGATRVVNVTRESLKEVMAELGMEEGFDIGLEMSGVPSAFDQMLEAMNHGGNIALLGIPPEPARMDWNHVIFKGLTIKGIYGREMFDTWYKMKNLVQGGLDLDAMITHRFAAEDFQDAFDVMRTGNAGKIILDWT